MAQTPLTRGSDVLLTFDTEFENDADALVALAIDVPATYFWTAEYARKYPYLLHRLAQEGNTIGSHSYAHDDLTKISRRQVQLDLEYSKMVLEEIAGVPITAFRAPYLQHNDFIMSEVERLGFLVDSSDKGPWPQNQRLLEIAVSEFENMLVSDHDLLDAVGLDRFTALDFLIRAYAEHSARGQPFVMLLHPRIIGREADVLHDFIAHVQSRGGRFLTFDDYLNNIISEPVKRRVEVWSDLGPTVSVETLLSAVEKAGATDLIVTLPDAGDNLPAGPTLTSATVAAIQARGIRVQLALQALQNPHLLDAVPTAAMLNMTGGASPEWVSPSHPEVRRRLSDQVRRLVGRLNVDGLHISGLGYPGLNWDFSPASLQRFAAATTVNGVTPEEILREHYLTWTQWRSSEVARLVAELVAAAKAEREDILVSISLLPEAAVDFRVKESTGQDYRVLGRAVDLIVPSISPFIGQDKSAIARLMLTMRTQVGSVPVLANVGMPGGHPRTSFPTATLVSLSQVLALRSGRINDVWFGGKAKRSERYQTEWFEHHFAEEGTAPLLHKRGPIRYQ